MKLPEEMPEELKTAIHEQTIKYGKLNFLGGLPPLDVIYKVFKDCLDKQQALYLRLRSIHELPDHDCKVWLWNGKEYILDTFVYCGTGRFEEGYFLRANKKHTHWTYAYLPEPPKEITE